MLKLTYIYHDCFLIQTESVQILFDYWDFAEQCGVSFDDVVAMMDADTPLYVVVSHHHKDHYSPAVFSLSERIRAGVHYILSNDTARFARHILTPGSLYRGVRPPAGSVTILNHYRDNVRGHSHRYCDALLSVTAFGSTDIGNSYVIETRVDGERIRILHAGDLNAWIWKDESTEQEVATALRDYRRILESIAEEYPALDVAMFPVDSRLGTDYFTGAHMLLKRIRVANFYPMHFCLASPEEKTQRRADALAFERYANPGVRTRFVGLTSPGDCTLTL